MYRRSERMMSRKTDGRTIYSHMDDGQTDKPRDRQSYRQLGRKNWRRSRLVVRYSDRQAGAEAWPDRQRNRETDEG